MSDRAARAVAVTEATKARNPGSASNRLAQETLSPLESGAARDRVGIHGAGRVDRVGGR